MENRQRVLQATNTISSNDAKTWPMIQSLILTQSKIGCHNVALRVTDVANDLGVQVNSKLRFSHHYENVVAKAHQIEKVF